MLELEKVARWDAVPLLTCLVLVVPRIFDENSKVRYYFCYLAGYCYGILLATILFPLFLLRPGNHAVKRFGADLYKRITHVIGVSWEIRNAHILAEDRGAVICSNHQSMLDALGVVHALGILRKATAIAKKEVLYVLPVGIVLWLSGIVFIDRKEPAQALKRIEAASEAIHQKVKLWIFPEGTRNKRGDKLLPFKRGAFQVAIQCQAPIIPMVYSPYYFIDGSKQRFRRGKMIIDVLEPIPTEGLTLDDLDTLRQRVYDVMSSAYDKLKLEVKQFA